MEKAWYIGVSYENAKELVKENLVNTVAAFIASGYWLKYIRDSREYEKDGYQSLWDCAEAEFGLKISEASRAMSMNDKYSVDGNTPYMAESYKQYNKSQLQEMLTMSDEQMEQVTPDMTVREIREIKNPKPEDSEEKLKKLEDFINVFVSIEYVTLYHTFPEAADINIKILKYVFEDKLSIHESAYFVMLDDEESEFVDADTGEILETCSSNTVIEMISSSFIQIGKQRSHPMPPKIKGVIGSPYCGVCGSYIINSPDVGEPCEKCRTCGQAVDWSEYIKQFCDIAKDEADTVDTECEEELTDGIYTEIEVEPEAEEEEALNIEFDTNELLQELDSEEAVIDVECREVEKTVEEELEDAEEKENAAESEQPEFPVFKNNEQRKAWLEDVEAWGLWYEDENILARYYKYDFPDGSRLIAVKYRYTCPPWMKNNSNFKENAELDGSYRDAHYHMIYSEEYKQNHKYEYENYFTHSTVSISTLIEFIKEISKKAD